MQSGLQKKHRKESIKYKHSTIIQKKKAQHMISIKQTDFVLDLGGGETEASKTIAHPFTPNLK